MTVALRYGRRDSSAQALALVASSGSLAIAGSVASLRPGRKIAANVGSIGITGTAATLLALAAPVWTSETTLFFVSGVPKIIQMGPLVAGETAISLITISPALAALGFSYDEPSDELRYDGTVFTPQTLTDALTVRADN